MSKKEKDGLEFLDIDYTELDKIFDDWNKGTEEIFKSWEAGLDEIDLSLKGLGLSED